MKNSRFLIWFTLIGCAVALFWQNPAYGQKMPTGLTCRLEIPWPEITVGGPAVTPALSFPATFELANFSSAPVRVQLTDGSRDPVKIGFRLLDGKGTELWSSVEALADGAAPSATLGVGQTWKRSMAIPLFINGNQLDVGLYSVEAFVVGSPDFFSSAAFRMTSDVVATTESVSRSFAGRKWGLFTTLTVADSRAVIGLRNGSNVRLAGVIRASFAVANQTSTSIGFSFADSAASQRKIAFSLVNAEGDVVWKSDSDVITLPVLVESILFAGATWSRSLDIPLYTDEGALPEGDYTIVAQIDGSPLYRGAVTIRVVNRAKR